MHTICLEIIYIGMCSKGHQNKNLKIKKYAHSCPVPSMEAQGTLLWQSALNMSLGMLHYLHHAFLWPR